MCYRICARGLSATIRYHNRYKCFPVMYHILKKRLVLPFVFDFSVVISSAGKTNPKKEESVLPIILLRLTL